jgi:hypothetical protein
MPQNAILSKMLERLYASILSGPALNCRPHSSRQRVDLSQLAVLDGTSAKTILARLLGEEAQAKLIARVAEPPAAWIHQDKLTHPDKSRPEKSTEAGQLTPEQQAVVKAWQDQQGLLKKLHVIAGDAATYEQDTGAHVLYLGFPILSFPPQSAGERTLRRILAPILFIPLNLEIKSGRAPSVTLKCAEEGIDRVVPNSALLAWIENQTGKRIDIGVQDHQGTDSGNTEPGKAELGKEDPWKEINGTVGAVCSALNLNVPNLLSDSELTSIPKTDSDDLQQPGTLLAGVLGLFPASNQALIQDTSALIEAPQVAGPISSFLTVSHSLATEDKPEKATNSTPPGEVHDEYLVSTADPCQARAVRLARVSKGLVVHGPPGTGKSQTITNIIGDHLARGQRVLFVCDKRNALDVVRYRLETLGLAGLCAVVHDPQRDQKPLYAAIRNYLEELPEQKLNNSATPQLEKINAELKCLHAELRGYEQAATGGEQPANQLHHLVGLWLASMRAGEKIKAACNGLSLNDLDANQRTLQEAFTRAEAIGYRTNIWVNAIGTDLMTFLSRPLSEWQSEVTALSSLAHAADEELGNSIVPFSLEEQAVLREDLASRLDTILGTMGIECVAQWAQCSPNLVNDASQQLLGLSRQRRALQEIPDDPEFSEALSGLSAPQLAGNNADLASYLQIASRWYSFVYTKRKAAAAKALKGFGLALSIADAQRAQQQHERERSKRMIAKFLQSLPVKSVHAVQRDSEMIDELGRLDTVLLVLAGGEYKELLSTIKVLCDGSEKWKDIPARLRRSAQFVRKVQRLLEAAGKCALLRPAFIESLKTEALSLRPIGGETAELVKRLSTVENLLRLKDLMSSVPKELSSAMSETFLSVEAPSKWQATLQRAILQQEISGILRTAPELRRVDAEYYASTFKHYRELKSAKCSAVREAAKAIWLKRQRDRLLAATGSRLNGDGAELKRRLYLKGPKAMRLRQVIAAGNDIVGGDPLFDLKPVWMASPETVAQIFPRKEIFDVLIFDEASQCRMEEALPVLTRAGRVVIAGDPKQLPPTRFFESAVASSETLEGNDEQGWFEIQQSEIEDLLSAALNLEVEQSFLDVHYRSRNADLIQFSNSHFYGFRLQAIPAHPSHKAEVPPLLLQHVNGVYNERTNAEEARAVVQKVRELLSSEKPPSIGVACFNLPQRDLIDELLKAEATNDARFAALYEEACRRRGAATFEGLFVKNLENVQGDERDHIIISTTYGPDPKGKFRRNFGPLTKAGGGRRLNVLVTRAREAIHLITSIPRSEYLAVPALAGGQSPNGAHLLFSYLNYAESLQAIYSQVAAEAVPKVVSEPTVDIQPSRAPSVQAEQLAETLRQRFSLSSKVHWGNEGFCVDVALTHPSKFEDVTIGVLCDGTRYDKTDDLVEWDVFRTEVLEGQGWKLLRLFSPNVFRDLEAVLAQINREHENCVQLEVMERSASSGGRVN